MAALLDLGADEKVLRDSIESLGIGGYDVEITRVEKNGISACDFNVILHDHDHDHEHRGLYEIEAIIDGSKITDNAKELAKKIFRIVAEAEAKVHGLTVDKVRFHEVGAVDSIVDIVGAAICADNLEISRTICTPLYEGQGTIKCRHGIIPVPAPATLEIAAACGVPLVITQNQGEMVTPTGIAIAAALCGGNFGGITGSMTVRRTGYGAGKRNYETAGVLRASIIEADIPSMRDN